MNLRWTQRDRELLSGMKIGGGDETPSESCDSAAIGRIELHAKYRHIHGVLHVALPARELDAVLATNHELAAEARGRRRDPSWKGLALCGWLTAGMLFAMVIDIAYRFGARP